MSNVKTYTLMPRDLLFFRDARPMDVDKKNEEAGYRTIGHGANWPRPDILHSAVMHELIRDPEMSEEKWYGSVTDLKVMGPFPCKGNELYLPMPLDWDMTFWQMPAEETGKSNLPKPLTHAFLDRCEGKKKYPEWISLEEYERYLKGKVGQGKKKDEVDEPKFEKLFERSPRNGITLDRDTGASKRTKTELSGRYQAEYLELAKGVSMLCEIEQSSKLMPIDGQSIIMGGQGGTVTLAQAGDLRTKLEALPKGTPSCYVRWTLITPALFDEGWWPNWLDADGKVMIPQNEVLRRSGEKRDAFRKRKQAESQFFESAKLIAARIGNAIHFSGWDSADKEKPTELAVPAGSCYVFKCKDEEEAMSLVKALHLKRLSDLGEKGFGIGVCSYLLEPEVVDLYKDDETSVN